MENSAGDGNGIWITHVMPLYAQEKWRSLPFITSLGYPLQYYLEFSFFLPSPAGRPKPREYVDDLMHRLGYCAVRKTRIALTESPWSGPDRTLWLARREEPETDPNRRQLVCLNSLGNLN